MGRGRCDRILLHRGTDDLIEVVEKVPTEIGLVVWRQHNWKC